MPVTYELPKLPYALDALEPSISKQILDLHYNRHHRAYVTNLNAALAAQAEAVGNNNLVKQLELQSIINFNAGGHINHTLFWESLAPVAEASKNTLEAAAPTLHAAIVRRWGSVDAFKAAFEASALGIQGSGWQWLVTTGAGASAAGASQQQEPELELATSKDQDLPKGAGRGIVLGIDLWEHAYYLQYLNNKKEYLTKIWDVVNWRTAEKRYKQRDQEAVFGA
ncbi:hypothetical protein DV738_g1625, partial [Chaetothyriales sp. CBS 135597]